MPSYTFPVRRLLAAATFLGASLAVQAMSVVAPTFNQLVGSATTIVRGVVTDVHATTVDTSQGTAIRTLVAFQVERVLKGTAEPTVTLTLLGGKVGPRTLTVLGMPTFKVGDREIVFIANNGRAICPLVAAGHGRYHVRHDPATHRDYVARDNDAPLASTDQIAQSLESAQSVRASTPAEALSVDTFEAQISAVASGNQTPAQP